MAASVTVPYPAGDLTERKFRPLSQPRQSILPLRRERTMLDGELNRSRESKPVYSHQLPVRSTAFSGGRILLLLVFSLEQIFAIDFLQKNNTIDVNHPHKFVQRNRMK